MSACDEERETHLEVGNQSPHPEDKLHHLENGKQKEWKSCATWAVLMPIILHERKEAAQEKNV